ncbi:hypothetical protein BU15DRAFT_67582 [Melanogaster broomeanus]|nr:hypothetical protein BU15DRAFT_67582 [Melanogaster broomeanus]
MAGERECKFWQEGPSRDVLELDVKRQPLRPWLCDMVAGDAISSICRPAVTRVRAGHWQWRGRGARGVYIASVGAGRGHGARKRPRHRHREACGRVTVSACSYTGEGRAVERPQCQWGVYSICGAGRGHGASSVRVFVKERGHGTGSVRRVDSVTCLKLREGVRVSSESNWTVSKWWRKLFFAQEEVSYVDLHGSYGANGKDVVDFGDAKGVVTRQWKPCYLLLHICNLLPLPQLIAAFPLLVLYVLNVLVQRLLLLLRLLVDLAIILGIYCGPLSNL